MSRSDRMFEIIQILRGADWPVTSHELAKTLEVAQRTVYRDIAALQAMRVPIEGEAGIGYRHPRELLTTRERESICREILPRQTLSSRNPTPA